MTVGDRIRQVRQEQDVTQQELADYIGVSKQAVYKYENNIVTNIPTDKVDAIAKRLKVSPAYLMGWEEQPTPKPTSPTPIPPGFMPMPKMKKVPLDRRDRVRRPHHGPAEQGRGCGCPGGRPL